MNKYPVRYYSESKKQHFDIEEMNDFHLVAAYNKLLAALKRAENEDASEADAQTDGALTVMHALNFEIAARNLDPQYKGGKPPEEVEK